MGLVWDPILGQCLLDDTRLVSISGSVIYSQGPSIFWIRPPTLSFGLTPTSRASRPHAVHLAYLNEMQDSSA